MAITVPDGVVTTYRKDGSRLAEATYLSGVLHGPYRDFWSNGRVSSEGQYRDGLQDGEWRFYDRDTSELWQVLRFVAGKQIVDWDKFIVRPGPER